MSLFVRQKIYGSPCICCVFSYFVENPISTTWTNHVIFFLKIINISKKDVQSRSRGPIQTHLMDQQSIATQNRILSLLYSTVFCPSQPVAVTTAGCGCGWSAKILRGYYPLKVLNQDRFSRLQLLFQCVGYETSMSHTA